MNELEQKYISSREVAEMVEKNHADLMRDIRRYSEYLGESKIALADYFKESTYTDAQGKERECYLISKKGCEFIAHKMTGQKGAIFTAKYIERFHEMQTMLQPKSQLEVLQMAVNQMVEQEKRLSSVENRLEQIEAKGITSPVDYYTISGFAAVRKQKVDTTKANLLGRKASALSKQYDYPIGKVPDAKYGSVNSYHVDILNIIM